MIPKVTMRCVGGPYAGQTLTVPPPRYIWYPAPRHVVGPVPYLVNIFDGRNLHCYLTVRNGSGGAWRLLHQDTF